MGEGNPGAGDVAALAGLRVSMVVYGAIAFDSRVQREALALAAAGAAVTLICTERGGLIPDHLERTVRILEAGDPAVSPRPGSAPFGGGAPRGPMRRWLARVRWLLRYRRAATAFGRRAAMAGEDASIWHLHDFPALSSVTAALPKGARFVYDSHEIFFDSGTAGRLPGPLRWWLRRREDRLIAAAEAVVTVNVACSEELGRRHPRRIAVVHNCLPLWHGPHSEVDPLREAVGLDPGDRIVLYHGNLAADRGLLELASAMDQPGLESAHLVYLGNGPLHDVLAGLAADLRFRGRIHLVGAVPPDDLPDWICRADVGAMPNQPSNLNERLSTPNKLFESIAVGLPVVSSDFPARRRIVADDPDGPLGALCDPTDPRAIGAAIRSILELDDAARADLRRRCLMAARERWNWEHEAQVLVELYRSLPSGQAGHG